MNKEIQDVYTTFDNLLKLVIKNYTITTHKMSIDHIAYSMKNIYENKDTFKFVFEHYYSDKRNPFISAYSQFMNCYDTFGEKTFYFIAEGIFLRKLNEKKTKNEFAVF